MWRTTTKKIIVATVILLISYDIFAAITPENNDTISEVIRDWTGVNHLWILPYYSSILLSHFYINLWNNTPPFALYRYITLGILTISSLILNLTILRNVPWYVTIPMGLCTGVILWGQGKENG